MKYLSVFFTGLLVLALTGCGQTDEEVVVDSGADGETSADTSSGEIEVLPGNGGSPTGSTSGAVEVLEAEEE